MLVTQTVTATATMEGTTPTLAVDIKNLDKHTTLEVNRQVEMEPQRSPLDDLLSPTFKPSSVSPSIPISADSPSTTSPTPNAAATSEASTPVESDLQELSLEDETRFSTVPLSAPLRMRSSIALGGINSSPGSRTTFDTEDELSLQTPTTSESRNGTSIKGPNGGEKWVKVEGTTGTVSPTQSVVSTVLPGADFILAKLDKDAVGTRQARASLDGKALLKEEFASARKRDEEERERQEREIDWDFWGLVMNDYEGFARNEPKKLAKAIEAGIPPALRGMIWQLMSASKDPELERTYAMLLKLSTPHEKAIRRDLGRTFPHHAFFMDGHGIGQESLFNVLKAYSLFDPECGYCQGLPFIVAPLLLVSPDEEAFCQLVRLMHSYELRGHFLPEMPGLQLRLFQFDRLIEEMLPVLHVHFLRQGVKSSMFCSQWFLTLFAYRFPLEIVFRIFDHILATGIEAIFSFSVLLLQKNEDALLKLGFDSILEYLKTSLLDVYLLEEEIEDGEDARFRVDEFVRDAAMVRITPFQLDNYAAEYHELNRARNAHIVEMDALRNENRVLKQHNKALEDALAQINEEHCEVIKQLVMARVETEEMEGELVKYKLLYAELMHANEDARSSHRSSSYSGR